MELWIRIQDNKKLIQGMVKVEDIFVDTDTDKKWCIQNNGDTLGIYKTKERALEVLDEIEKKLSGIEVTEITNKSGGNMNNIYPIIIYKMPEK